MVDRNRARLFPSTDALGGPRPSALVLAIFFVGAVFGFSSSSARFDSAERVEPAYFSIGFDESDIYSDLGPVGGEPLYGSLTIQEAQLGRPKVAIIIDDIGMELDPARELIAIDKRITISILPYLPKSERLIRDLSAIGVDTLLHLPLEAKDPMAKLGPGALLTSMSDEEIENALTETIDRHYGVVGVNNHMGSLFTEDADKMRVLISALEERSLVFIDSRVTPGAVARAVGAEFGIDLIERDVFLDNVRSVTSIVENIEALIGEAEAKGYAVGIGHPYPETIEALKIGIPKIASRGATLTPISSLTALDARYQSADGSVVFDE